MAVIKARSIFGRKFETDEEGIKACYKAFKEGSNNLDREEKPLFYFSHHIESGITFEEFNELVKEV